jgi:hypothetical protein
VFNLYRLFFVFEIRLVFDLPIQVILCVQNTQVFGLYKLFFVFGIDWCLTYTGYFLCSK